MKKKVYAYLHTHWDREWYRDKEDFNLRLLKVFDCVIEELTFAKAPFFYFDGQTVALEDYLKYRPEKENVIKKLIKEQKLAIGPYFVCADSYLINFASMLKNIDIGLEISKKYNQQDYIGYMADIFGISNSAFLALKNKNITKALVWRGVNPEKINNNCNFIKNDVNTCWLTQGYFNDFFHLKIDIDKKVENIKKCLDKISKYSTNSILLPIGADHLGILRDASKKISEINQYLEDYEIILTNPFEYFKNSKFKKTSETEFLDNSDTYILQGCYSAHIPQKIKNDYIQNKLSKQIELVNHYLKLDYDKNIDFCYKTLIKNHAHDGICGCSIDEVTKSVNARLDKCVNILNALNYEFIGDIKKKYNISDVSKDKIGVLNLTNNTDLKVIEATLPYKIKNSQVIKKSKEFPKNYLYDEYKIPVTEEITTLYNQLIEIDNSKSMEFNTLNIIKPIKKTHITKNSIENDYIKLMVKNSKIEILDKISNEKIKFKLIDTLDDGDSYNYAPVSKSKEIEFNKSKILTDGLILSTLRLHFKDITLDISLNNYSKFLEFNSTINNKKKNHKIQAVFILNNNIGKTVSSDPYGVIERKIDYNYSLFKNMPTKKPFELKTNCFPMTNFVNFENNSILIKGLNEYEIYKKELRICLLRSFSTISNPKNQARYVPAGPNLETKISNYLCKTTQNFAFLFGDYKDCFNNLDIFNRNYMVLDGKYEKDINFKLDKLEKNEYLYCINDGKKVTYKY